MSNDNIKYTTPVGTFLYPRLITPDTKFNADGVYSCKLAIPADDAKELIGLIETEVKKQGKIKPIKKNNEMNWADPPHTTRDDGEVVFSTKQIAHVTLPDGKSFDPVVLLFDAHKERIDPTTVNPWTGTRGKLRVELIPYSIALTGVGVSLRLKAAQILELVEGGASAESCGFGDEEEFSATTEEQDDDLPF